MHTLPPRTHLQLEGEKEIIHLEKLNGKLFSGGAKSNFWTRGWERQTRYLQSAEWPLCYMNKLSIDPIKSEATATHWVFDGCISGGVGGRQQL